MDIQDRQRRHELTLRRIEQQQMELKRTVDEVKSTQVSLGHDVLLADVLEEKLEINFPVTDLNQYLELNRKLEESDELRKLAVWLTIALNLK